MRHRPCHVRSLSTEYMFYLVELAIGAGHCVAVRHDEFNSQSLANSTSSFPMPEAFDIEHDDFDDNFFTIEVHSIHARACCHTAAGSGRVQARGRGRPWAQQEVPCVI